MRYRVKQTEADIDEQLNRAYEAEEEGGSCYPGMTFEQGVKEGIEWLTTDSDEPPIPEAE